MFYTLGQRQGLGIGGIKNYPDAPWFVAAKNLKTNDLIVVQGVDHPTLFAKGLLARQINWIESCPSFRACILPRSGTDQLMLHAQLKRMVITFT